MLPVTLRVPLTSAVPVVVAPPLIVRPPFCAPFPIVEEAFTMMPTVVVGASHALLLTKAQDSPTEAPPPPPAPQADPVPDISPREFACRHCVEPVMPEITRVVVVATPWMKALPSTESFCVGLVVAMPTFPFAPLTDRAVEKLVPPFAVEYRISKFPSTLLSRSILKFRLVAFVRVDSRRRYEPAPLETVSVELGVVVPIPTLPPTSRIVSVLPVVKDIWKVPDEPEAARSTTSVASVVVMKRPGLLVPAVVLNAAPIPLAGVSTWSL